MTDRLVIEVLGAPAPQGSKKPYVVNGRARLVESSAKVKPWRHDVALAARAAAAATGWTIPAGPIRVDITFRLPRPRYHYGTGRNAGTLKPTAPTHCDKKPDLDKLTRSSFDALTVAGVVRDDAQIVAGFTEKRYADGPTGARITITPHAPEGTPAT